MLLVHRKLWVIATILIILYSQPPTYTLGAAESPAATQCVGVARVGSMSALCTAILFGTANTP